MKQIRIAFSKTSNLIGGVEKNHINKKPHQQKRIFYQLILNNCTERVRDRIQQKKSGPIFHLKKNRLISHI